MGVEFVQYLWYSDVDTGTVFWHDHVDFNSWDHFRGNWLFVNTDRDDRLRTTGFWSFFVRNLHGSDFSLFWANIRQNAIDRTQALIEARAAADEDSDL